MSTLRDPGPGIQGVKLPAVGGVALGLFIGLLIGGSLTLTSCQRPPEHHDVRTEAVKLHHLTKGRYTYQDSNGDWWWYVYASTGKAESKNESLRSPGSWQRGGAPAPSALADRLGDFDIEVVEDKNGEPVTGAPISIASVGGVL